MATRTEVILYDDLDRSTDRVTTHQISLDGHTWQVDLSEANLRRLREALAPFVNAGRRLPTHRHATVPTGRAANKAVRRWWLDNRDNGELPPFRTGGPIPSRVRQAYQRAHR